MIRNTWTNRATLGKMTMRPQTGTTLSSAIAALGATALVLSLAPIRCGASEGALPTPQVQEKDSAGIRIIENASPPEGSRLRWRIGSQPTVSIGEVDGEEPYLLHVAWDATRLRDGRIVITNTSTQELRVFDARGTYIETWGGAGEGPGEFAELWQVEPWPGDSIVAWTAPRQGISVFASDGSFGRTFNMEGDGDPLWAFFSPQSVTRDGSVLAVLAFPTADTLVAELKDGEGRTTAELGTHTNMETHRVVVDGRASSGGTIFGRRPVYATWGDRIVIGSTDRYELKAFGADGSLERLVRRGHVPRAPTAANVAAYIDENVPHPSPGMSDAERQGLRRSRRVYESMPVARHFPAFTSIITDAMGHLWVEEYEFPGEERPGSLWTVFDAEGQVLGFLETPEVLTILEIGADYILTWNRDDLDVEYVQLWPLDRRGGSPTPATRPRTPR